MKYVIMAACAMVVFALIITPSPAGDCQLRVRTVYPTYVAPVYVAPTHNQYLVVPKVIEVEVHRDHYYSIDPNYNTANVIRELRLLLQEQQRSPAPQTKADPTPPAQPKKEQVSSQERGPSPYQKPELLKVVNDSCAKCHAAGSKFPLVTPDGKLADLSEGKANKTFRMVNAGEMPKAAKALDDTSTKLFYDWAVAQEGR